MAEAEEAAGSILARSRDRPIAALATSPLARARQTAESIGLAIGREPFVMHELLDLDHGAWEGLTAEEAGDRDPVEFERFREDPRGSRPPGGEPLAKVEQRMRIAVASLAARYPGEQAVAVSHEIPIRLLLSGLRNLDGPEVWAFDLPTASVTAIERGSEGNWAAHPVQLPKPPIRP